MSISDGILYRTLLAHHQTSLKHSQALYQLHPTTTAVAISNPATAVHQLRHAMHSLGGMRTCAARTLSTWPRRPRPGVPRYAVRTARPRLTCTTYVQ
eukprot:scaffold31072_cov60-Phaeocystis_antarctica.AAC.6